MVNFYQEMLDKWKAAIFARNIDSFFVHSNENSREMKTRYISLSGDVAKFTEWLEMMAAYERSGQRAGAIQFSTGGI
jgi:hypothetical protein